MPPASDMKPFIEGRAAPSQRPEFAKTTFTQSGRPKLGTTLTLHATNGEWEDAKVVAEFSDGERQSLEWPLVPAGAAS